MPYIGKTPTQGVRQRYMYTATAGQTTFSGTDTQNLTLSYSDSNFIDVYQNGVLLKTGTDYTATSGTSVVLTTGASVDDVVEMIVYDVFASADFFNRTDSDSRYVNIDGDTMTGSLDLNGTELILDVDGDTSITADTDDVIDLKIAGSDRGNIHYDTNDYFTVESNDFLSLQSNVSSTLRSVILGNTYFKPFNADDNVLDLGISAARWKDLYLSGGAYIGGTGSSNYLDDYEEGTWLPGIEFATAGGTASTATSSYTTGGYTKIGKAVCVEFNISNLSFGNGTGNLKITGLPFTPSGTGAYSGKANASSGHLTSATTAAGYLDIVKLYGTTTGYFFMYSTGNSGAGAWNHITNSNASTISLNSVNGSFTYFTDS